MLKLFHGTLVHGKDGGQMIEAEAHEGKPAAEGCDGLAEDGILLALQLREQAGKS